MLGNIFDWISQTVRSPSINWTKVLIAGTLFEFTFTNTLRILQYRVQCHDEPPAAAKEYNLVDEESFAKSQAYQRAKLLLSIFESCIGTALTCYILGTNLFSKVWYFWDGRLAGSSRFGEKTVGVLSSLTLTALGQILDIPGDLVSTFGVEEKFGFNKQSFGLWIVDTLKGWVIGAPVLVGFVYLLQALLNYFGARSVPYILGAFLVIMLVAQVAVPAVIMPMFNKFEPLEDGELRTAIENLAASQKFPLSKLYVIDGSKRSSHSNAFFMGMPWYKQIVLYDTLIKDNTTDEVVAVLAHELGHWKHNHILAQLTLGLTQMAITFSVILPFLENQHFYQCIGFKANNTPVIGALFCAEYAFTPLSTLLTFTQNFFSRAMEYDADRFATRLGKGSNLSSALITLNKTNLSALQVDPLYSTYNHSHPIIIERLNAIKDEEKKLQ